MSQPVTHRGALSPGTQVQEYVFQEVLGHGGFGITYRGLNTLLQQVVAIKEYMPAGTAVREVDRTVLPRSEQDEKDYLWGLGRFLGEAQTLARFDHPCIVRVQHFFQAHGTGYIVMEYLEGQTLGTLYDREKIVDERRLRGILTPLLEALEQIHDAKFLHRDIKPGNIMFRGDSTAPVLIDFGAARAALAMRSQTMTAIVTPGYSPIEQYSTSGEGLQGPWTDIYSLGAVLYRGMSGIVPNDATDRTIEDRLQATGEAVRGRYSRSLVDAVDWALRMRTDDRPRTIREWRETLEKGASPPPPSDASARSSAAPTRPGRSSGTGNILGSRVWVAALGIVAVLAVGSVAYWWDGLVAEPPGRGATNTQPSGTDPAPGSEARREAEARAAEVKRRLEICDGQYSEGRVAAALGCYQEVLAVEPDHAVAASKVRSLAALEAYSEAKDEDTVEAYFAFEQAHPGTALAGTARFRLRKMEESYWKTVQETGTRAAYKRYRRIYPDGRFTEQADTWLKRGE